MQKGKKDSGGLVGRVIAILLAIALSGSHKASGDTWERAMGGVRFPGGAHPVTDGAGGPFVFASVSASNPYSIPGLFSSAAALRVERRGWAIRTRWERLSAAGYSGDLLAAAAELPLPLIPVILSPGTEFERMSVEGSGSVMTSRPACSLILELAGFLDAEARACGGGWIVSVRAVAGEAAVAVTLGEDADGIGTRKAGASISVAGRISLMTGICMETGEVSGGVSISGRVCAAVSWSSHPVLGTTCSVSIGAVR